MPASVLLHFLIETMRGNAQPVHLLSSGTANCKSVSHVPTTSSSISTKNDAPVPQPCPSSPSTTHVWYAHQTQAGIRSTENASPALPVKPLTPKVPPASALFNIPISTAISVVSPARLPTTGTLRKRYASHVPPIITTIISLFNARCAFRDSYSTLNFSNATALPLNRFSILLETALSVILQRFGMEIRRFARNVRVRRFTVRSLMIAHVQILLLSFSTEDARSVQAMLHSGTATDAQLVLPAVMPIKTAYPASFAPKDSSTTRNRKAV